MMMKKNSSRNQRASKGIKWKHVLQICVLVGVCVWLIYQVKYSHDKKKEFYENDVEASKVTTQKEAVVVKLGRKDLPHSEDVNKNERVVEDEDEDVAAEEEEMRRGEEEEREKERKSEAGDGHRGEEETGEGEEVEEEEEEEEKNKQGEEDEAREEENKQVDEQDVEDDDPQDDDGAEDDIDEHDQGKTGETDREDETREDDKEREVDNGEEGSESNGRDEEEEREVGNGGGSDEIDMTVHEAREEHYKADDASSAVSHGSRNEKGGSGDSDNARVTIEEDSNSKNTSEIILGEGEDKGEEKDGDGESFGSNTRREKQYDEHPEAKSMETEQNVETGNGNSTVTSLEASGSVQNGTESTLDSAQEHNKTESVITSDLPRDPENKESDSFISISANVTKEDSMEAQSLNTTSDPVVLEKISDSDTAEAEENSESSGDGESGDKESLNLSSADEANETVDSSDNAISQEEKDVLTDPQTLPDVRTGEIEDDDAVAAE